MTKEKKHNPPAPQIAVIIVNYGTAGLAIDAVESVRARTHGGRRVIVHLVDNASPGEDAEILSETYASRRWGAEVKLWLETNNHGFGRGNNVVLRALAAQPDPPEKVFLLNPDARLDNEAIEILAETLDADSDTGAAGACVLRPDLKPVTAAFRFPDAISEIARAINLTVLNRLLRHRLVPLPADQPPGLVDWVSGASVMFRFDALKEVDFFDPGFFLYYEEVDLMRRLHEKGWHVRYNPQAQVIHEEGAATGQFAGREGSQRDPAYLYESWRHYFTCAYGRFSTLMIALLIQPAAFVNVLHRRMRGHAPTLPARFFLDHWRYVILPLIFGKRV